MGLIETALMVLPLLVAVWYKEYPSLKVFLFVVLMIAAVNLLMLLFIKPDKKDMTARDGIAVAALGWIFLSVYGAIPFYISGQIPDFMNALFESISGFTTTGASILSNVESLSKSMMFWRCLTHWIGGMGVLVLTVALLPSDKKSSGLQLMRAECPGPTVEKLVPKGKSSAMILYFIYAALTCIMVTLLLIGGMPLYDSVCHAFGTAGTGGFNVKNAGLAFYDSAYIEGVVTVFMILFGVNFNIYYFLIMRKFVGIYKNTELKVYLGTIIASITVIIINTMQYGIFDRFSKALRYSAFQVGSIMTSTGYATADFDAWPEFSKTLLICLMFVGACAGSTGGGFKVSRVIILAKTAKRSLRKAMHPKSVNVVKADDKALDLETVHNVSSYLIIYIAIFFVSLMIIALNNFDFGTSFSSVTACLNNIGPGISRVGPTCDYSALSNLSKSVLSIDMLLGRLECLPLLMLCAPSMWNKKLY
ncbi:MAG: TrkH family potassium uptake protein [Ruminococcus sp.]|nr:TrkH family potassium uptake protein [Ruminococcus sp.]